MYLTLNAPDLARPLFRAIAPHLPAPLDAAGASSASGGGSGSPEAVWNDVQALEEALNDDNGACIPCPRWSRTRSVRCAVASGTGFCICSSSVASAA